MPECLFCRIVARKIPASIVYETDTTLAFRDIHPRAPVHVLLIPKEHIDNLMSVEPKHAALWIQLHSAIQAVARQERIDESGFRLVVNNGPDSGQEVHHLHLHLLAGKRLSWHPD